MSRRVNLPKAFLLAHAGSTCQRLVLPMLRLRWWLVGCDQDNVDLAVMGADTNARDECPIGYSGGLIGFNCSMKRWGCAELDI